MFSRLTVTNVNTWYIHLVVCRKFKTFSEKKLMSLISPSGHKCVVPYVKDTLGFFQFEIKELILKILVFN